MTTPQPQVAPAYTEVHVYAWKCKASNKNHMHVQKERNCMKNTQYVIIMKSLISKQVWHPDYLATANH